MRAMFLASQKHQSSQQEHDSTNKVIPNDMNVDPVGAEGMKKSYEQLQAEETVFKQVKVEMVEASNAEEKKRSYEQLQSQDNVFKQVKLEMVEPSNAEEKNLENKKPIRRRTSKTNKTSQPKVPRDKVAKGDTIKCGMEVGLTSPNSAAVVALGTVQNVNKEAKCMDGKPLSDYVEVLVNVVLKGTTLLPRSQGRVLNMGNAQARSIPWPRENVTSKNGTPLMSKVIYMLLVVSICEIYMQFYVIRILLVVSISEIYDQMSELSAI
ncbi:uncharacterized protein LOC100840765 isoform X2 [Brachypodium distachyon]|uniref:DUF8039 domain-containing protein n=1 Tax=Brachypodium distachyon TaxID=15368 RepID=A0A2K2CRJ9_BRADI|nr:uncharacterized protein LOC100840765 isoform X2 [Brachypodium distachyon]PNT64658.1 hypothetical protein BRADI_4g31086v3 [Brachypodium distachyon]|eukprot:XP_014757271.1 uncharacterized protein LOC100840765 isoform X2 [Brachypodium distachyon]